MRSIPNIFKNSALLLFLGIFGFVNIQTQPNASNTGGIIDHFRIGDVVYSVLKPDQFAKLHGAGWVPLDSRDIFGSQLQQFYPSQLINGRNLPEGRGVFIRTMNSQDKAGADPDKNRTVGSFQDDELKSHSHVMTHGAGAGGKGGAIALTMQREWAYGTDPVGGVETRPKNIALYVYIKIND